MNDEKNIANDPSTVKTPRKKTMTEAALEANHRNATKSTGPRTPNGKLKAAFIEQFNPIAPTEVTLVHQLIHMQIRFLQMEFLYGEAMRFRVEDIISKPANCLTAIIRELDRLPTKIQRTIKVLRAEIAQREAYSGTGENVEIEAIADSQKLPGRPPSESTTISRPTKATWPKKTFTK